MLNGFPLVRGDTVLLTNHTYNAVRLMAEARCAASGAQVRTVNIPMDAGDDAILAAFKTALTPR